VRPKVIQIRRLTKDEQRINRLLYPETGFWRDVDQRSGSIRLNYPGKEPWDLEHSCSLDIADLPDELTLEDVGEIMCVTRERVRQIESVAQQRLKRTVGVILEEDDS